MTRKILMASLLSASALAFAGAAAAGGSGYGQTGYGSPAYDGQAYGSAAAAAADVPTPERSMSEGLMGQSSLQQMDIRSSDETAFETVASPAPDPLPGLNLDQSGRLVDRPQDETLRESAMVAVQRATFPVRSITSTASEGLAHEQLALEQRVLFDPEDQVVDPYGLPSEMLR